VDDILSDLRNRGFSGHLVPHSMLLEEPHRRSSCAAALGVFCHRVSVWFGKKLADLVCAAHCLAFIELGSVSSE
jgi:hypothetical protein